MEEPSAFGMGGRMSIVLYPVASLLHHSQTKKILLVGPRTEDDIFWAKGLGLNPVGLDLMSYSPYIRLGDIHKTDFDDNQFDAIILGWMISYSSNPEQVIRECNRILKPNGFLGIGIESNKEIKMGAKLDENNVRVNYLNSAIDMIILGEKFNFKVVYTNDIDDINSSYDCSVVLKKSNL